jgi:arylsulfatase A-like enzyme
VTLAAGVAPHPVVTRLLVALDRAVLSFASGTRGDVGCSADVTNGNRVMLRSSLPAIALVVAAIGAVACGRTPTQPSFLLFVFDTTRLDAISAYGRVSGTTPGADRLAATGLRYTRAYAQAPWTLPSHASLFTGLLPGEHGLTWRHSRAPDDWVTLAERLHDAGYETVGVSENGWISPAFNMTQGFERFANVPTKDAPDVRSVITRWLGERTTKRPFFLFVNVTDPHAPYAVKGNEAFLPPGVTADDAQAVPQDSARYFCSKAPHAHDLEVLHALYLGDVHAADAKLTQVLDLLDGAGLASGLVTIVTADHGEHFGEHRLVNHLFSLHEELLHVPLIVHGLAGASAGVIDTPVALTDVMPTILVTAGLPATGQPLPSVRGATGADRIIVAEHMDFANGRAPAPPAPPEHLGALLHNGIDAMRRQCGPTDHVFGGMRVALRYPWKLIWYTDYPAELFDLEKDPGELHDLAASQTARVTELEAKLTRLVSSGGDRVHTATEAKPTPEILDRLRALGYLPGQPGGGAGPRPAPGTGAK